MSRGTKITILIAIGIIAIGAILYFIILPLFSGSPNPATNANANVGLPLTNAPAKTPNINVNAPLPAAVSPEVEAASSARSVARTFAERLDTYTNRNGLVNLDDLRAISTPAVWKYLDSDYRKELAKAMPADKAYYSVVSTAMNVSFSVASADEMTAKVGLQRVESGAVSKTSYPTLDLKLRKDNDGWLVSWLEWEKL
jgi:hypothetical protein